ncbi:MAG: protein kinase [Planctomycetes bacterium]|nr:protein kinase [Planctomycetota bacterium]
MAQSADEREFAELLLEWGFVSRQELEEAVGLHEAACHKGSARPSFTDTLIKYGFLTPRQVAEARSADVKGVFQCTACEGAFSVRISADRQTYRCPRCQQPLVRRPGTDSSVTIGLISDAVPVDVQVALHKPESRFGKYVLLREVGRGGAAVIKRAWDTEERCYVALKFLSLPQGTVADPAKIEDFLREGERAVHLRHPNIIRVYEVGRINAEYYLAMECLEGYTLAELIKSARMRGKITPFYEDAVRYLTMVRDVARAVHYAHTRAPSLIHCDLKPANIFIELSWRPYVLDFGVAQELSAVAQQAQKGTLKGSPAYMAPEQVLGKPEEIDARTDVYGLGSILYDLLAGRPPFTGELQEVLDKNLLMVSVPKPSEVLRVRGEISTGAAKTYRVPPEVEEICTKCLEKDKKDRYATAKDVADALTRVLKAQPVTHTQRGKTTRRVIADDKMPEVTPLADVAYALKSVRLKLVLTTTLVAAAVLGIGAVVYVKLAFNPRVWTSESTLEMAADKLAMVLRLEEAEQRYQQFEERNPNPATHRWVEGRLEELAAMKAMRSVLIGVLLRKKPVLAKVKLRDRAVENVRIEHATAVNVRATIQGEGTNLAWGEFDPRELIGLLPEDSSLLPQARLGAAHFAAKNGLYEEALRRLERLDGTSVEVEAKRLMEELQSARR